MRKWGKVKFDGLKQLQKELKELQKQEKQDKFYMSLLKEIGARFFSTVVGKTEPGIYPEGSGKVGGTLQKGWTVGEVRKEGSNYIIEIINPVEYASYVEYGHRTRDGVGWVDGKFMMTITEDEIRDIAPKLIEHRVTERLKGVFGGK